MNKEDFISELMAQTGLNEEDGAAANDIFEKTFLAGKQNKSLIISQLSERLNVSEIKAEMIYDVAVGLLTSVAIKKVKNHFKK